jgi:hypothetical protein
VRQLPSDLLEPRDPSPLRRRDAAPPQTCDLRTEQPQDAPAQLGGRGGECPFEPANVRADVSPHLDALEEPLEPRRKPIEPAAHSRLTTGPSSVPGRSRSGRRARAPARRGTATRSGSASGRHGGHAAYGRANHVDDAAGRRAPRAAGRRAAARRAVPGRAAGGSSARCRARGLLYRRDDVVDRVRHGVRRAGDRVCRVRQLRRSRRAHHEPCRKSESEARRPPHVATPVE